MPAKRARGKRIAILIGVSVLEICFRASATLVAQPLKHHVAGKGFVLHVPMLHLLLETCSFPVSLLAWISISMYKSKRIRLQNWRYRLPMYFLMAIVDSVSSYSASIGLNIVPASIFTILGSAAIVFSIILMKMLTKKKFTQWHFISVLLTFVSVSMLFLKTATNQDQVDIKHTPVDAVQGPLPERPVSFLIAMCCCLLSAFLVALLGVLNYVFFVHENLKYDIDTIVENNAFQSLFAAFILIPLIITNPEASSWPFVYQRIVAAGNPKLFIGVCIGIWLSRSVTLFSSVATTAFASAVLTRALGGPRRLLVMLMSWLVFKESMPLIKISSGVLMCIATVVYVYGGYKLQQQDEKKVVLGDDNDDVELQKPPPLPLSPSAKQRL